MEAMVTNHVRANQAKSEKKRTFPERVGFSPNGASIEDLAREVGGKCLQHASDLLNDQANWMGDDAKMVRTLVETACAAQELIPKPLIKLGFPSTGPADRKATADAIRTVLEEEAKSAGDLPYT